MKINFNPYNEKIDRAINELKKELTFSKDERFLDLYLIKSNKFEISYSDYLYTISYEKENQIYFAISYALGLDVKNGYKKTFKRSIENLSFMADCSRNAVLKVETIKKLIRYLALYGYDSLMLYTEDTYVVKEYPYFGYLRNPYTKDEIKEIEDYAAIFNIELVPCIQTLAHFSAVYSSVYFEREKIFDINDILMVDNEKTYKFIESLIKTCREYFKTDKIHIGLDEAALTGRGKFLDCHEYQDRFTLISKHLDKVLEICKKYNFKAMMWSDMFVEALERKKKDPSFDISKINKDVKLFYWNYFDMDEQEYSKSIEFHTKLDNEIGFAGAAWKWLGFSPDNRFSYVHLRESFKAVNKYHLKDYIVTAWGDNGAEASIFSILPSILYASMCSYSLYIQNDVFKEIFTNTALIPYDLFMVIDLPNRTSANDKPYERSSANKYLLYNDPLLGRLDTTIDVLSINDILDENGIRIWNTKELLNLSSTTKKWNYLFNTQHSLMSVLRLKANFGNELRKAYKEKDLYQLNECYKIVKVILKNINKFKKAFREQWNLENKPNGIDVFDLRIGALTERLNITEDYLRKYLKGTIKTIPELEEELLDFLGNGKKFKVDYNQCEYRWRRMTSVNIND